MQFNRYIVLIILTVINCFAGADAPEFFTDRTSKWVGGSFNFSTTGGKGRTYRNNLCIVSPFARIFVARYFMVGPRFQWTGAFSGNTSMNQFGLGLDYGFAYGKNEHVIPYFRIGGQLDVYSYSRSSSEKGFTLPIGLGFLLKTKSVFAIHIEPSIQLKWVNRENLNIICISFGFAGVGKKVAVSTISGAGSVHY